MLKKTKIHKAIISVIALFGVSLDIENYCTLRLKINLKTLD